MRTIDGIDYCDSFKEAMDIIHKKFQEPIILQLWHLLYDEVVMNELEINGLSTKILDLGYPLLLCRPLFEDNDKFMIPIYHPDFDIKFGLLHDKRVVIKPRIWYD